MNERSEIPNAQVCLHVWRDHVVAVLEESVRRAQPTGSDQEPRAIVSFSVELIERLLKEAPRELNNV